MQHAHGHHHDDWRAHWPDLLAALAGGRRGPRGRGWAAGFPFGDAPGGPRGRRARRGDVRAAILALLAEEPRNGYQIMQEIEVRSDGRWRPSPGSVYPALQQLEDEGLVRAEEREPGRVYVLTDAGRGRAEERGADRPAPWESPTEHMDSDVLALMDVARQAGMAVIQIARVGSAEQQTAAREVLSDTRKRLYGILAEDAPADDDDAPSQV
jgi:DNA-binding PadR family transcriptional regulator